MMTEVMPAMICRRKCHIYGGRSPFECNGSCSNAMDICPGLWWHNTACGDSPKGAIWSHSRYI